MKSILIQDTAGYSALDLPMQFEINAFIRDATFPTFFFFFFLGGGGGGGYPSFLVISIYDKDFPMSL